MKRINRVFSGVAIALLSIMVVPAMAFAHVVVTPAQAGVGARTLFNVSVPNEKEVAVTSVKLIIPNGVQSVQPNVMAGWTIDVDKSGDDVTAITWTGDIPVGERADLVFKAQTPTKAGDLDWKAYQTYADGTVVNWDQAPSTDKGDSDANTSGPYSVTSVVDDLTSSTDSDNQNISTVSVVALVAAIAALLFSITSLLVRRKS